MELEAIDLRLSFPQPDKSVQTVLDIERLSIAQARTVGLTGPSGAGKTSLMYALTGIQPLDRGTVRWGDVDITGLGQRECDRWRRINVGIVFQNFHLFPGMSILQNVTLPATFGRTGIASIRDRAKEVLSKVGAPDHRRRVETLSRGERQRVGIARALLLKPRLLFADEPTANLDAENAEQVTDLLFDLAAEGTTLFVISHDRRLLDRLDTSFRLERGVLSDPEEAA